MSSTLTGNRGVKRRIGTVGNTEHVHPVCYQEDTIDSQFPKPNAIANLRSCFFSCNVPSPWQHRRSKSAPSDQISAIEACG